MRIAVVILNWNTRDYLRRFLPPLLESVRLFNGTDDSATEAPGNSTNEAPGGSTSGIPGNSTNEVPGGGTEKIPEGWSEKAPGGGSEDPPGDGTDGVCRRERPERDFAEVIVADNASEDGSAGMMAKEFPSVRTIVLDRNYGFTGGYNRALKELSGEGGRDLFILLNSDVEVSPGWLRPLADWMKSHPDCGACGPKLHSLRERGKFEYAGAAGGLIDRFGYPFCRGRVLGKTEADNGQYDIPADVLWITGACLAVRAGVWNALGGLDERFFAHMEEIDLCWRMQLEGWSVTVVPESVVYHLGGGTLPQSSPWKLYLNYRNNILLLDNNLARTIGRRKARLRIFLRKLLDGCAAAVYLLTMKPDSFKAVWKAHRDAGRLTAGKRRDADEKADAAECAGGYAAKPETRDKSPETRDKSPETRGGNRKHTGGHRVAGLYDGCIILRALLRLPARES